MTVSWMLKSFDELTPLELYKILQLRNEVFVVEQNCVFQDADDRDQPSFHLMGKTENSLAAYCRLVPPGLAFTEPSIGRVVNAPAHRGSGIGKKLMQQAIAECQRLYGPQPIKIGAQLYLKKFYESLDFIQTSDIYLEDGIEHIYMLRS